MKISFDTTDTSGSIAIGSKAQAVDRQIALSGNGRFLTLSEDGVYFGTDPSELVRTEDEDIVESLHKVFGEEVEEIEFTTKDCSLLISKEGKVTIRTGENTRDVGINPNLLNRASSWLLQTMVSAFLSQFRKQ